MHYGSVLQIPLKHLHQYLDVSNRQCLYLILSSDMLKTLSVGQKLESKEKILNGKKTETWLDIRQTKKVDKWERYILTINYTLFFL